MTTYLQTELPLGPRIVDAPGDLLAADVDALVNAVNCVGVMGKGIALQFKAEHPLNFAAYAEACRRGEVRPGRVFVGPASGERARWILNVPTKRHWRDRSRLADVEAGLADLAARVVELGVGSLAVPALGCGLGGLSWSQVRPLIVDHLAPTGARVLIFGPRG